MAYFSPFIDAAGLHLPVFSDIADYELASYESVYGQIINTDNSNVDIQWINNFSLMINDAFAAAQLVYNSRSPVTAIGADLDGVVELNGIARKEASYSTVVLTLSGTGGVVVPNGVVQDTNGYLWDLPENAVVGTSVTAKCETIGAIAAQPNTVNIISSGAGTQGWTGVTNPAVASQGQPVEQDSQLRARQAISVALVAKTLVGSTLAGIAAVAGVSRYNPGTQTPGSTQGTSIENPTGATDSWGNPAHSISMVVEGGTDLAVATAIYNNKTPGCFTNGTTTVGVTDPNTGAVLDISFFRPIYDNIYIIANVHGLNVSFTSATIAAIQVALLAYVNSLQIGEIVTQSGLYAAAMSVMVNISQPNFSIHSLYLGTAPSPTGTADINIAYNHCAGGAGVITVNSV